MARILITEFIDEAAVVELKRDFDVHYDPTLVDRPEELISRAAGVDALIVRNRTLVRGALLEALGSVRVIGRLGVGLDNIDVEAAQARGIRVIPATDANARSVAEYVIATSFILLRRAYLASASVAAGKWPLTALSDGRELGGKTLGLVGFGSIGRLTAQLAQALGLTVIAHDPGIAVDDPVWGATAVAPRTLDALLAEADILSLHLPLLPSTRSLIDAERLARFKPGAILINTARGGIVDEVALAAALKAGRIAGAALDVFDEEPLAAISPLADAPNLILTPHIAGVSRESNQRVSALIAAEVAKALKENPDAAS